MKQKTLSQLNFSQVAQAEAQWSDSRMHDFYYEEGLTGTLICRRAIPAEDFRSFQALHPRLTYRLFNSQCQIVGVIRFNDGSWDLNGASLTYEESVGVLNHWVETGRPAAICLCHCEDCFDREADRLLRYIGNVSQMVCPNGGAKMMLRANEELQARLAEQDGKEPAIA